MRSGLLVAAVAGLAAATPLVVKRQEIEFDQFDAATPIDVTTPPVIGGEGEQTVDNSAAVASAAADPITSASSKVKRAACDKQPPGKGPLTSPDTAADFRANPVYDNMANSADVPDGYSLSFHGLNAANNAQVYITYYVLDNYDPYACQEKCDAIQTCSAFNLYMERDPTVEPADGCANPTSTTNIKCSLWGAHIDQTTAVNTGQMRDEFEVVVMGSNGYNKLAAPANNPGFDAPVSLSGAINAPDNSYMGYKYFTGPYNPSQCANACLATTSYNQKHPKSDGTYNTCSFFNSYVLSKNGAPQGTYCSMYTSTWSNQYATNYGQYRGSDHYTVGQSYGWALSHS